MRSYRDSTWNKRDDKRDTFILGPAQLAWLKRELAASNATWKVIAADLPIGLISEDAIALGDGPLERREHEVADLLSFIKRAGVRNTVWLTADMHYTAAHYYDPNRAVFQDFDRSGNSSQVPCTPAPGTPAASTTRSARARSTRTAAAPIRARTSPPATACNFS